MNKKILHTMVVGALVGSICISGFEAMDMKIYANDIKNEKAYHKDFEVDKKEIKIDEAYINGNIKIPVVKNIKNEEIQKSINDLLEKNINQFMDEEIRVAKTWYESDHPAYSKVSISSDFNITMKDENILSLVLMANSTKFDEKKIFSYTIDINTGKEIPLYKLFDKDEDYKEVIKKYIMDNYKEEENFTYVTKSNIKDDQYYLKNDTLMIVIDNPMKDSEFSIPIETFEKGFNTDIKLNPNAAIVNTKKIKEDEKLYKANIYIPVISGNVDQKVADKINELFEKDALAFNEGTKEGSEEYAKEVSPFVGKITFEETKNENDLLSIYMNYYKYTGGAHGQSNSRSYNIDLKTGNIIELKDLFKEEYDYKKTINGKIKEQIAQINEEWKEEKISQGQNPEYIGELFHQFTSINENQDYYLKDDKIVIYFQPEEIESAAIGIPAFEISMEDLEDGLKVK